MKKIVTLLICALLIAALAIPALAADASPSITISADKATAAKGETITFTITASNLGEFKGLGIQPRFDTSVFTLLEGTADGAAFTPGSAYKPGQFYMPIVGFDPGKGLFATFTAASKLVDTSCVIGTFTLEVIADCGTGVVTASANMDGSTITVNQIPVPVDGEHTYGDWAETKAPTCTTKGEQTRECAKCGHKETAEIATIPHSYTPAVTAPTCTEEGFTTYTCACGDSYVADKVPATGHTYGEWYETKAPTCTVKGEKQRDCANCDHFETAEVATVPHAYKSVVTAPTCTEKGYTTYTCSLCGNSYVADEVPATGHKMGEWVVVTDSTCTAVGEERSDCSACDHFETREIPLKAHDYVNAVVTAPTCTEKGYTTRTCVCGASIVDTYVNPTGHKFEKNWQIEVAPTCTAKGEERDYCANGCGQFNTQSVPATGHTYNEGVITTAPECEKEGVKTFTCIHGDHSYTEAVPATGHTPAEDAEVTKEPTCTEKGEMSGKCAVCGKVLEKQEIPALGHKWGEWTVTTPATCTAKGVETRACATCHETETKSIQKIPHDLVATVTAPTCTAQGFTTYNCKNCDHSETAEYVKATGHQMGEWTVTKDSTCIEQGEQRRDCANCDHFETEKLPLADHKYEGTKVEPTCTEPGKESGKCSVCGDEVNEKEIPALGHDFGEYTVTTEPGCETEGEKTASCSRCDATDVQKIAATGHTFGDWIKVDEKNHKHVCACGHEETVAHNWDSGNVVTPATHSATGLKRFECKDCHATREEELAKLNKHDDMGGTSKPIKNDKDEPDKKYHTAVCTCGEEHKEEHSYTFIEIIEEATEGKKGKKLFRCDCGVEDIVTYRVDGTLDKEPGTGDITGQVVMTGVAAFSMLAAAAYVFTRKRTA